MCFSERRNANVFWKLNFWNHAVDAKKEIILLGHIGFQFLNFLEESVLFFKNAEPGDIPISNEDSFSYINVNIGSFVQESNLLTSSGAEGSFLTGFGRPCHGAWGYTLGLPYLFYYHVAKDQDILWTSIS